MKIVFSLLLLFLCNAPFTFATDVESLNHQAETAFIKGDYANASQFWQTLLALPDVSVAQRVDVLTRLAAAHQARGRLQEMLSTLEQAQALSLDTDHARQAQIHAQLSDAWLSMGDLEAALLSADIAVEQGEQSQDNIAHANALFSRGNVRIVLLHYPEAQADFKQVQQLLPDDRDMHLKITLNLADMDLLFEDYPKAYEGALAAERIVRTLKDNSLPKVNGLLAVGALSQDIQRLANSFEPPVLDTAQHQQLLQQAEHAFVQAAQQAEQTQVPLARARAYGRLGNLYEYQGRYEEALQFTQQAIFFAEQEHFPELLYRWHWQRGRLLKYMQQLPQAIKAFRRAATLLQPVQQHLHTGYRSPPESFDQAVRPVYYGLADLLLLQAAQHEGEERQTLLREAMDTVERVKVAELQDYFRSDCSLGLEAKEVDLAVAAPDSAVLYPIPLDNRLVLLLNLGDTIYQANVDIGREALESSVWLFYSQVQNRTKNRFMYAARDLYDYLIRPVVDTLRKAGTKTLVVAPDGALRLVPFAAFHDGKRFLIEEFALVTTPSLSLTDPRPISWEHSSLLLVGLSDSVQGYSSLPGVPKELKNIQNISAQRVGMVNQILNQEYSLQHLTDTLKAAPYSIVHLATHGEFGAEPENTYLLTYKEKLHMDQLQEMIGLGRTSDTPVELLTLSACKTATGDDRAALGLAGVAIKAGARSALASLWFVDDEAASLTVTEFYRLLLEEKTSKARALQGAQTKLIGQSRYKHPAYWGPFLLIGNWL